MRSQSRVDPKHDLAIPPPGLGEGHKRLLVLYASLLINAQHLASPTAAEKIE